MHTSIRVISLLGLAICGALVPTAAAIYWAEYRNARFGLHMRYPAHVFSQQRTSEARDGDLFSTADESAKLLVGAFENTDRFSPSSYQHFIARESYPGLHVDYAPVGGNWAVLSGTRGDMMVYEKVMFSCGGRVISSFALIYPIAQRQVFDPVVEGIEDSFRPGANGCDQHVSAY